MKPTHSLKHLLVAALAGLALQAAASGLYRWTDANGTVQYSDRPPEGIEAEFIEISTGTRSKAAQPETKAEEEQATASGPQAMEVMPEKDPALCKQAQKNLKALEAARIRISEPDGSRRFLTEEEKETQRVNNRKFVKIHC